MLIKNVVEQPLDVRMTSRTLTMEPGEEALITAEEVRDVTLREHLQQRTIAIVRPATDDEGESVADAPAAGA